MTRKGSFMADKDICNKGFEIVDEAKPDLGL